MGYVCTAGGVSEISPKTQKYKGYVCTSGGGGVPKGPKTQKFAQMQTNVHTCTYICTLAPSRARAEHLPEIPVLVDDLVTCITAPRTVRNRVVVAAILVRSTPVI